MYYKLLYKRKCCIGEASNALLEINFMIFFHGRWDYLSPCPFNNKELKSIVNSYIFKIMIIPGCICDQGDAKN
jgi:hypothetical protein